MPISSKLPLNTLNNLITFSIVLTENGVLPPPLGVFNTPSKVRLKFDLKKKYHFVQIRVGFTNFREEWRRYLIPAVPNLIQVRLFMYSSLIKPYPFTVIIYF